jgi:hypothetical protein
MFLLLLQITFRASTGQAHLHFVGGYPAIALAAGKGRKGDKGKRKTSQ